MSAWDRCHNNVHTFRCARHTHTHICEMVGDMGKILKDKVVVNGEGHCSMALNVLKCLWF